MRSRGCWGVTFSLLSLCLAPVFFFFSFYGGFPLVFKPRAIYVINMIIVITQVLGSARRWGRRRCIPNDKPRSSSSLYLVASRFSRHPCDFLSIESVLCVFARLLLFLVLFFSLLFVFRRVFKTATGDELLGESCHQSRPPPPFSLAPLFFFFRVRLYIKPPTTPEKNKIV